MQSPAPASGTLCGTLEADSKTHLRRTVRLSAHGPNGETSPARRADGLFRPRRLGFLISDTAGPCLAVQEAITAGALPGCVIALVICNITGAPGVEAARSVGLRAVTLEGRGHEQREHEDAVDTLLRRMGVDLLCIAGYRRVLSRDFIRRWPGRILALHASLLPAFPSSRPQRQALEFGAQITGCTVSLLDESTDVMGGGPVVVQRAIPILDDDTELSLSRRLAPEEDNAYIEAIRRVTSGGYQLEGRRYLPIDPAKTADETFTESPEEA